MYASFHLQRTSVQMDNHVLLFKTYLILEDMNFLFFELFEEDSVM